MSHESFDHLTSRYPQRRSALLPIMDELQRDNGGYLSRELVRRAAQIVGTTVSEAHGIATHYSLFNTRPVGTYHLQVDTCVPGFLSGADEILRHLERRLGITAGQTTGDKLFTLSEVADLASCGTAPVVQVNDTYFENLTIDKVDELIASLRAGRMPEPDTGAYFASECNILLKNRGNPDAVRIDGYRQTGGYVALAKALAMPGSQVAGLVKEAMLRGRGGAGFPAGTKWGFLPKNDPRPVYLICNADEGEPGTFKDRQIMQYDPHLLIEGIAIAAHAIGAKRAYIYIRGELRWIATILEHAIAEAKKEGLLAHVDVVVHRGAGSYICGEETALIESLEGHRGCPRIKPPFPANKGLYGCPTIVNNVETLACVPYIIEHGPAAFKAMGVENSFGQRIFGVSGHVNTPGVFEMPMGIRLDKILSAAGGVKGKLKAVIVGGLSVPILTAAEAEDLVMDFDSCAKAGTAIGSAGIMVINDTVAIPELALRAIRFYAHESCGQCVPCWRGTHVVEALLHKIVARRGSRRDLETILGLCATIKGATLCPGGEAFAAPIHAMITKFRGEFEAIC
jgi:NADH:ubiquinone oxidoreductase subunit F (NADH-binding)/NADH:ubiquinone oxidoreductase subunit E